MKIKLSVNMSAYVHRVRQEVLNLLEFRTHHADEAVHFELCMMSHCDVIRMLCRDDSRLMCTRLL